MGGPRPSNIPVYVWSVTGVAAAPGFYPIFALEAIARSIFVHRVRITNPGSATAAALRQFYLVRTVGASSAGVDSRADARPLERIISGSALAAADAALRSGGATITESGSSILRVPIFVPAAVAGSSPIDLFDATLGYLPPIHIPDAASALAGSGSARSGLALVAQEAAAGAASLGVEVLFTVA